MGQTRSITSYIGKNRRLSDPVAYLFKNIDPRGSLAANVSNSTVRCLSNLPLAKMLVDRHDMSRTVREEVTPKSNEWGYQLGSIYIRKVHFRDPEMIRQIESKVVNRLRQAAVEFGKAAAVRPSIVGKAMAEISDDTEACEVLFELLETHRIVESKANLTLVRAPEQTLLADLLTSEPASRRTPEGSVDMRHGEKASFQPGR